MDRILGGAEVNLVELLDANAHAHPPLWQVVCACAKTGPLRQALSSVPNVSTVDYSAAQRFNTVRLVDRSGGLSRFWRGWRAMRAATDELSRIVADVRPNIVVSCTNKDHFAAARLPSHVTTRRAWWVNDLVTSDFFSWPARQGFKHLAKRSSATLIAVSQAVSNALVELGLPLHSIRTSPNGIPIARYARTTQPMQASADHTQLTIGVIGRFTPWKGQQLALEVAKLCRDQRLPVRFILVGQAFNEDQAYELALREFVDLHQLQKRVEFRPFQNDITSTLSQLDILLHASTKPEPFGRVIIEAMAAGVAVIAARNGGVTEILTHNQDGWLAQSGSAESYVQGISTLLTNPTLRARLTQRAMGVVHEKFNVDRVLMQFDRVIHENR